jgi:hypothetical protein
MKLTIIAVLAFVIGLVAGVQFYVPALPQNVFREAARAASEERYVASVCLIALDELQGDHPDRAKSFLAQQIAIYYRSFQRLDASPTKQKLVDHVEASSRKCPELKDALSKTP